jgi:arginase
VAAIGVRENDEALAELASIGIPVVSPRQVRERGPERVVADAVASLGVAELDGFWVHCDVDVLDAELMPAVDTPEPDGLDFGELASLLGSLLTSGSAAGLQVTIFDPDLDEDGTLAARLADRLCEAFGAR